MSPKETFFSDSIHAKDRREWLSVITADSRFDECVAFAMAQVMQDLGGKPGDEHKIVGAKMVLDTLMTLSQRPIPKERIRHELNPNA